MTYRHARSGCPRAWLRWFTAVVLAGLGGFASAPALAQFKGIEFRGLRADIGPRGPHLHLGFRGLGPHLGTRGPQLNPALRGPSLSRGAGHLHSGPRDLRLRIDRRGADSNFAARGLGARSGHGHVGALPRHHGRGLGEGLPGAKAGRGGVKDIFGKVPRDLKLANTQRDRGKHDRGKHDRNGDKDHWHAGKHDRDHGPPKPPRDPGGGKGDGNSDDGGNGGNPDQPGGGSAGQGGNGPLAIIARGGLWNAGAPNSPGIGSLMPPAGGSAQIANLPSGGAVTGGGVAASVGVSTGPSAGGGLASNDQPEERKSNGANPTGASGTAAGATQAAGTPAGGAALANIPAIGLSAGGGLAGTTTAPGGARISAGATAAVGLAAGAATGGDGGSGTPAGAASGNNAAAVNGQAALTAGVDGASVNGGGAAASIAADANVAAAAQTGTAPGATVGVAATAGVSAAVGPADGGGQSGIAAGAGASIAINVDTNTTGSTGAPGSGSPPAPPGDSSGNGGDGGSVAPPLIASAPPASNEPGGGAPNSDTLTTGQVADRGVASAANPPDAANVFQSASAPSGMTPANASAPPSSGGPGSASAAGGGRSGAPPANERRFVPNEVLVTLLRSPARQTFEAMLRRLRLQVVGTQRIELINATVYHLRFTGSRSMAAVVRALEGNRNVASAQPNYIMTAQQAGSGDALPAAAPEGDPAQYALSKLHLTQAHNLARGDNVLVAVVDSGIDATHPELAGVIAGEFDALGSNEPPHPHGTSIAGVIAAHARLMGAAPAVRILAVRALSAAASGATGTTINILRGLDWAAAHGARIVNMSFAGPSDPLLARGLAAMRQRGAILIAAAGNAGPASPPLYPGADPNVIAVTATDADDRLFAQANRGSYVAIAAPGVDILVPMPGGAYGTSSGTSLASAYVAGVAALILERKPKLDREALKATLLGTARDLGPKGRDDQFGAGLADAYQALIAGDLPPVATSGPNTPAPH